MPKQHGARPADTGSRDVTPSYDDLGIHKMQASRWQRIASLDADLFEHERETLHDSGREITKTVANWRHFAGQNCQPRLTLALS